MAEWEKKADIKWGILGILTKISLNLNPFPPIPLNFEGNKNLRFWGKMEEWAFPPNHFISSHLNSQTREWAFHSLHQNSQIREEKNILNWFFSFYSIPSSQTTLNVFVICKFVGMSLFIYLFIFIFKSEWFLWVRLLRKCKKRKENKILIF